MAHRGATIEYRKAGGTILRPETGLAEVLPKSAVSQERQRNAIERRIDSALAGSFPASDPPPWTFGITRPHPEHQLADDRAVVPDDDRSTIAKHGVIDVSRSSGDGSTFFRTLMSWAGAAGIALLVPFIMLLIGGPIVLGVYAVAAAVSWLFALLLS